MPKLYSSDAIVKVLEGEGFEFVSQKGSHAKYRKDGSTKLTVIVPAARGLMWVFRLLPSGGSCAGR